ncbi:MAG TPA: DUF3014 domain-containing protein [Steroidobacteraceae bacterium]|nr:DUF3014 domain-containing protein [Steroidobacteraceae bacterium]
MWEDDTKDALRTKILPLLGILVVIIALVGGWYWWSNRPKPPPVAVAPPPPPPVTEEPAPVTNPVATPAAGGGSALPALNDSDQVVRDSLIGVYGRSTVEQFLVPTNIVRNIVVTVDNLPRKKVAVDRRPVKPTPPQTVVTTQGDLIYLSEANFERYTPIVHAVQTTNVKALAVVYQRLYPLFQQAYENLGYPGKYFNDRLVETIDNLLETPEVQAPIALTQPRVMYEYADAALERRSAGQKLLIRMGPANARAIKDKLREFRAEVATKK